MTNLRETRMDKTVFAIAAVDEESDETAYWLTMTPHDRLAALEFLRQVMYGYDPLTARLQRVLTITEQT